MAYVSPTRSNDSYEAEKAQSQETHERAMEKVKEDEEKTLTAAKVEYQSRLKQLKDEANQEVRRLKENSYDSQGRRLTNMERDNLDEKKRITHSYETALDKVEEDRLKQEKRFDSKLRETASEASSHSKPLLEAQRAEFVLMAEDKRREADETKKYYQTELAKEVSKRMSSQEEIIKDTNIAKEKAINVRSEKYNEFINESTKNNKYALKEKNNELIALKNTSDPTKVSPEARKKIEESFQQRFNKDLQEENRVHAANMDGMKARSAQFQKDVREEYAGQFNDMSKDLREKFMTEKSILVHGYNDLEANSEKNQKVLQDRQVNLAQRAYEKHTNEMNMQENRNLELMKDQRISLVEQKFKEKDELESKQRAQDREWAFKLNDTCRDYEKKITDQKDLHEKEMSQARFEFDKKLQEQQRTSKKILEDRAKAYEAQIFQQDSSYKEHGRLLTEHYEEELDKMKRTNARITQTKS